MKKYRIKSRKREQSNLTCYTLQVYVPKGLFGWFGSWMNVRVTYEKQTMEIWKAYYGISPRKIR